MRFKNKTIGVLGGIGPEASANIYQKIIKYSQNRYGAVQDSDYPPIIIYSLPMEGFDETGIADEDMVRKSLAFGVKKLEDAGSDMIIIACNTVHSYIHEMQKKINIPIFNIIDETIREVKSLGMKRVGLMASESTKRLGLYQKYAEEEDVEIIPPTENQQAILNSVIEKVMGGNQKENEIIMLKEIIRDYAMKGAEGIILGCTELPLAINQLYTDVKLFDSMQIIVQTAVNYSLAD